MKKKVEKRGDLEKSLAAGFLFAGLILIFSLISKFFFVFDGFTGLILDLFGEFGYDLNAFGIILGTLYGFVVGFGLNYLYGLFVKKLQ